MVVATDDQLKQTPDLENIPKWQGPIVKCSSCTNPPATGGNGEALDRYGNSSFRSWLFLIKVCLLLQAVCLDRRFFCRTTFSCRTCTPVRLQDLDVMILLVSRQESEWESRQCGSTKLLGGRGARAGEVGWRSGTRAQGSEPWRRWLRAWKNRSGAAGDCRMPSVDGLLVLLRTEVALLVWLSQDMQARVSFLVSHVFYRSVVWTTDR